MKRIGLGIVAGVVMLAAAGATLAAPPTYTYVEGGYNDIDVDDLGSVGEGDGYFLGGSVSLGQNFHLFGRWNENETDANVDQSLWWIGGGWHGLLGERGDVVAELAYVESEFDGGGGMKADDSGALARAGVRFRLIKLLEVGGFYKYQDLDVADTNPASSGLEANAILYVWRLGIGLGYEDVNDIEQFNAFVRFNLGRN